MVLFAPQLMLTRLLCSARKHIEKPKIKNLNDQNYTAEIDMSSTSKPNTPACPSPLAIWHQLVKKQNPEGLAAILADNIVFHSPVVHTPQQGKDIASMYLNAAFQVLFNDSFHYVREVTSDKHAVLEFKVGITDSEGKLITVNGVDMMTWDEEGKIIDFKVMLRPLKAVHLIHRQMGELLAASS